MIFARRCDTPMEQAERMQRARAWACLLIAAVILVLDLASVGLGGTDFLRGMSMGVTAAATLYLPPIYRWLKPNNLVAQLFDDESTREHRRMASTAGLVAAMAAAISLSFLSADHPVASAFDTARLIASAAMIAALTSFATLELRAQRAGMGG